MAAVGQVIRQLREEAGWGLRELEDALRKTGLNLSYQSISLREKGGVQVNPRERRHFAQAFGKSLDEFDAMWRGARVDRSVGSIGIPVVNRAPAGMVIDYEEYGVDTGQGFTYIERGDVDDELAFAVIVVGDSMEPRLYAGDYLVLSPMTVPRPKAVLDTGKVVFVRFGPESRREGCCIAVYDGTDDGKVRFSKANARYKPFSVPREHIQQLAVAVDRRTKRI